MGTTTTPEATTAGDLRMGDVVLSPEDGDRQYAAYDLQTSGDQVTVWTAAADQRWGWPASFTMPASTPLTVVRRAR